MWSHLAVSGSSCGLQAYQLFLYRHMSVWGTSVIRIVMVVRNSCVGESRDNMPEGHHYWPRFTILLGSTNFNIQEFLIGTFLNIFNTQLFNVHISSLIILARCVFSVIFKLRSQYQNKYCKISNVFYKATFL